MNVIDNRNITRTTFRDIDIGQVFQTEDGNFFLKCSSIETDEDYYNCVDLGYGEFDYCTESSVCFPVKATLMVE